MTDEEKRTQWYAVQVLAGQENKVFDNLNKRMKTEEMGDFIFEVVLPVERVQEIKRGKKTETVRKIFPGYILVNMHLLDDNKQLVDRTWYFIKDTTGVIGFAGTKEREGRPAAPVPMRQGEIDTLLAQIRGAEDQVKPKITFAIGEVVKVADGAFQNQSGVVEEIDPDRGKLRVAVSIFGRNTLVDLEYWQVERT